MPALMLVDDNEADLELAQLAIADSVHGAILTARGGSEALQMLDRLETEGALPRVVLLDLKMPRMDGFDVLRAMRDDTRFRTLPVVVFSASQIPADIARSYSLGANGYAVKPLLFETLAETLRAICTYWLKTNISTTYGRSVNEFRN
jgi:CheY-like chemotaxis protein